MIILPRLLGDLLAQVDERRGAELGLDFADHAVDFRAEPMTNPTRVVSEEYMAAARQALRLGRADDRLLRAHEAFVQEGWRSPGDSEAVNLLDSAVRLACQDMLIEAGVYGRPGRVPLTPQDIAKSAQSVVGRRYSERAAEGEDVQEVNRRARWEEARWQVQRVIATEPVPGGGTGR
ncbi:hypothetical protein Stsp02_76070 [Streptomyces sp. NBRC 14336]|uniref:hypothetical protein n=1 Tax=Streptomyces sp. NBRC 14336 TaxID=3030992 RepID=UPI0024A4F899|nr:hypothetical protein [Streptomyces sp. NBRC 14336]GLW51947.1 hypothetical protein Stsp02_76070 [Streptomyces sp. NBRC 14336]